MSMAMWMGKGKDLRLRWHVMAWRQSADGVLGRGSVKVIGDEPMSKVRCTSSSWKKFLLYEARFQSQTPVVLYRSSMHACERVCRDVQALRIS
jgi:hypothetical protein